MVSPLKKPVDSLLHADWLSLGISITFKIKLPIYVVIFGRIFLC